jgi:hypothetical protein
MLSGCVLRGLPITQFPTLLPGITLSSNFRSPSDSFHLLLRTLLRLPLFLVHFVSVRQRGKGEAQRIPRQNSFQLHPLSPCRMSSPFDEKLPISEVEGSSRGSSHARVNSKSENESARLPAMASGSSRYVRYILFAAFVRITETQRNAQLICDRLLLSFTLFRVPHCLRTPLP